MNYNGFTYCEKCTINSCLQCADVDALNGDTGEPESFEICMRCEGNMIVRQDRRTCQTVETKLWLENKG